MSCSGDITPVSRVAIHDKLQGEIGKAIVAIVSQHTDALKAAGVAHISIVRNYEGDVVVTPLDFSTSDWAATYPIDRDKQVKAFEKIERDLEQRFRVADVENDVRMGAAGTCGLGSPVKLTIKQAAINL